MGTTATACPVPSSANPVAKTVIYIWGVESTMAIAKPAARSLSVKIVICFNPLLSKNFAIAR